MAANTQFSIAVHLMAALGDRCGQETKSGYLALSINTSASFVRRTLSKLAKAGLVRTATGQNGACWLAREPKDVSLLEIYRAIGAPKVFAIHDYAPQQPCYVSCNIKCVIEHVRDRVQSTAEETLGQLTLADVLKDLKKTTKA